MSGVQRVVIVGPGAAGKSVLAARLGLLTGLPVIELDRLFWRAGLAPAPRGEWAAAQRDLTAQPRWIMDGDLGPYDVAEIRFQAADTIIFLDFGRLRCAWRAVRRSRQNRSWENADFWRWLWTYRRRSRPLIRQQIAAHGAGADEVVLATPRAVRRYAAQVAGRAGTPR
jgi:adenylate kinase family enzyme